MSDSHRYSSADEDTSRHIHRGARRPEQGTVEVDSADFFSPVPPSSDPTPPPKPPKNSNHDHHNHHTEPF